MAAVLFGLVSFSAATGAPAGVMLQIGAYASKADADAASVQFKRAQGRKLGEPATEIQRVDLGAKGVWFRLLLGPFADRDSADRACASLMAEGVQCFLTSAMVSDASPKAAAAVPKPPVPGSRLERAASPQAELAASPPPAPPAEPEVDLASLPPWIVAVRADAAPPASSVSSQSKETNSVAAAGTEAERLLRLAEEGDAKAQYFLAGLYKIGRGVQRSDAQALRWYRAAAEKGLVEAQFDLGKIYDTGVGAPRDPFEAVRWYRLAAQKGFGRAQYNLGAMHGNGEGVPVDYLKAYMWFSISEATLSGAERDAARLSRDRAASLMMPNEVERALEMARRCLTSAYQNCD